MYSGNNNPEAATIISEIINNGSHLFEYGMSGTQDTIVFARHPEVFPDVTNVIHINDTYYITEITIDFENNALRSFYFDNHAYRIDTNEMVDALEFNLSSDGRLVFTLD